MIFTDIRLQNFRSYQDASFEIGDGVTIVVGPNAAGKTNLIEAIMLAATGGSYRGNEALIRDGEPWARIDVHTADNALRIVKIETQIERVNKSFVMDDKPYKRLPNTQKQPVVLFEPNNLFLLHGEPAMRRLYIDDILEQLVDGYGTLRNHYKRTLSQRNALLRSGERRNSQMFAWNIRLTELATKIVRERMELLTKINQKLSDIYSVVANMGVEVTLVYKSKLGIENYATNLLKKLETDEDLDFARGFTGSGPHRDDLYFVFGNRAASSQASRGEIRTLLLSLKIIELELIEEKTGNRPLLLLDDVFSELDGARRKALTQLLNTYQTVITTTDADVVVKHFTKKHAVILV